MAPNTLVTVQPSEDLVVTPTPPEPKEFSATATPTAQSSIPTPLPPPPVAEISPPAAAVSKDREQRKRTDRAKGWYDFEFVLFSALAWYPDFTRKFVAEDFISIELTYDNDEGNIWTEVPPPTTSGDTAGSVVLLRLPPNPYGRMPNRLGFDNAFKQADAAVIFPSHWNASDQLKDLKATLRKKEYLDWELEYASTKSVATWEERKRKPVIFLLCTNAGESSSYENTLLRYSQQRKKEIEELQQQGEDVLLLEADFSSRKEMQAALSQMLDYVRSGRGILAPPPNPSTPRKFSRLNFLSRSSKKETTTITKPQAESSFKRWFSWKLFSSSSNTVSVS